MPDHDVGFLNALRIARGDVDQQIHFPGERAAGFAGEGDNECPESCACSNAADNVRAVAAGGEGYEYITRGDERFDLPLENMVEAEVVRGRGEHGRIRGQGQSGEPGAVFSQADHEFRREMQRIRGASPITEEDDFPAGAERLGRLAGEFLDTGDEAG